jgi:uncharacterized membrane protein HdeD (DUF308 family)
MVERMSQAAVDAGIADTRKQVRDRVAKAEVEISEHWIWYLLLGIVLFFAGLAAIAFPFLSTIAAKTALGWIFLVTGTVMIVHAFSAGEWRGFVLNLLIGVLQVIAGGYLAFLPLAGILTLTILVAGLFLADGLLEAIMAFQIRPHEGWHWVLASGLGAAAVGVLIALHLPTSATWAIGALVGIKMILAGCSFIALAIGGHRLAAPTAFSAV